MKACVFFGTRPEAIKLAPVIQQLRTRPSIETKVIFTGQHAMAWDAMRTFNITPDVVLQSKMNGANIIMEWEPIREHVIPNIDWMIVQGDTASAVAGAGMAFGLGIKVAHVEAGLRTYSRYPYPEEVNRRAIALTADYNFAPTKQAAANLKRERVQGRVLVTGNTIVDAMRIALNLRPKLTVSSDKPMVLVTTHRRENWSKIQDIAITIKRMAVRWNNYNWLYSVHPNPVVKNTVKAELVDTEVFVTDNVDYVSWLHLMKRASIIITDSGGIQEEAAVLGRSVLLLRDETERGELIEQNVKLTTLHYLEPHFGLVRMQSAPAPSNVYGDGWAAVKIVDALEEYNG